MYIIKQLKDNFCHLFYFGLEEVKNGGSDNHEKNTTKPVLKQKSTSQQEKIESLRKELADLKGLNAPENELKAKHLAEKVKKYSEELDVLSKKDTEVAKQLNDLLIEINAEIQKKNLAEKPNIKLEKNTNVKLSDIFKKDFYLSELPQEISSISYKGVVYTRAIGSRKGEFISNRFDILKPTLKMDVTLVNILTKEDLLKKSENEKKNLDKYKTTLDKEIIAQIREKGYNEKIMFEKVKNDILTDDDGVNIGDDDKSLFIRFPGYPKNKIELNKEISESLGEERFNKGAYHTPKKILEDILDTKDEDKRNLKIEKELQPQIELATKVSPGKWAENVSLESPELNNNSNAIFLKLLNLFFKAILGIDFFKNIGKDYDILLEKGENVVKKIGRLIGGVESQELGSLSEYFESRGKGPLAIYGNDGGTPSFGTYQLHNDYLGKFAKENGIKGDFKHPGKNTEFAKNWLVKVKEIGVDKFKEKEYSFIKKTHYEPQIKKILSSTGVNSSNLSMSLKGVIWSTCVQHGPNTDVVITAIGKLLKNLDYSDLKNQKKLIIEIYNIRGLRVASEKGRYLKEKNIALKNLNVNSTDLKDIPKGVKSFPAERSSKGTTLCSLTAHKNLTQTFGVSSKLDDAMDVYKSYKSENKIVNNFPSNNGKVADLFSSSIKYPQYGHRSVAFNDKGSWYVLDPYLPVYGKGKRTTSPIRWEDYSNYLKKSGRQFYGARIV